MKAQARKSGQTQTENRQGGQKNLIALVELRGVKHGFSMVE